MKKPTVISLFAGGGGMSLGMKEAGFRSLLATDIRPSAALTFAHNSPKTPFFEGDIRRLTRAQIEGYVGSEAVDLIAGGPPCQGFSTIGDQNPADQRNGLFWCFVKIVEWVKPSCVLLENVNYLRTQYGGRYEREIIDAFERLGYRMQVCTLNAADFGVPQIRKRVFFFGTRLGGVFTWPVQTHGFPSQPHAPVWPAIKDLSGLNIEDVPNHSILNHGPVVISRYKLIPEGGRMPPPSELPEEIRRKNFGNTYKRLHRQRPALTMVPGNNAFPVHPTRHRSLSPREAARIQTFPDDYVFFGSRAEQCQLVGNAVPVLLARRLGEAIRDHLKASRSGKGEIASLPSASGEVIALAPFKEVAVSKPATPVRKKSGPTAVSFFSGVGGLMLGFLNAGCNVLASYDKKKSVEKNLKVNFPEIPHVCSDAALLMVDDVKGFIGTTSVDIVFGGPPCQGFSIFGRRRFVNTQNHRPEEDERNDLSLTYIDLALGLSPKVIFLENVKGFVSTQLNESTYVAEVERKLRAANYEVGYKVVNCAEYGVPQQRERFILVAWKQGLSFQWPEPKYFSEPKAWQRPFVTVGDVISDLLDPSSCGEVFSHVPMNHKELVVERYKLIPEGGRLPESGLPEHLKKG